MASDTVQEPQFLSTSQGEEIPSGLEATEVDVFAYKLWRHANCVGMMSDECECCKGAAQECFVTCR